MDRSLRVAIETADLPWEESPARGVWRKKLEREAAESGQVTSVVRYGPDSRFSAHTHPRGEEIFVSMAYSKTSMATIRPEPTSATRRERAMRLLPWLAANCS